MGARNAQLDVLAAIWGGDNIWQHRNVDGALDQFAPKGVGQVGGNVLTGWRRILAILDAQQQATARCIGKGNAILGDFAPVCRLAGHCPQGLLVEELSFQAQMLAPSVFLIGSCLLSRHRCHPHEAICPPRKF
jgi:hypothetical protein